MAVFENTLLKDCKSKGLATSTTSEANDNCPLLFLKTSEIGLYLPVYIILNRFIPTKPLLWQQFPSFSPSYPFSPRFF